MGTEDERITFSIKIRDNLKVVVRKVDWPNCPRSCNDVYTQLTVRSNEFTGDEDCNDELLPPICECGCTLYDKWVKQMYKNWPNIVCMKAVRFEEYVEGKRFRFGGDIVNGVFDIPNTNDLVGFMFITDCAIDGLDGITSKDGSYTADEWVIIKAVMKKELVEFDAYVNNNVYEYALQFWNPKPNHGWEIDPRGYMGEYYDITTALEMGKILAKSCTDEVLADIINHT